MTLHSIVLPEGRPQREFRKITSPKAAFHNSCPALARATPSTPVSPEPTAPTDGPTRTTRWATRLLDAPFALLSRIEGDQEIFQSIVGLPEHAMSFRTIPMSDSLAQHVIASSAPFYVADIREVPTLRNHPTILLLGLAAFVGVALRGPEGNVIGALYIADRRPRVWTARQVSELQELAHGATTDLLLEDALCRINRQAEELELRERAIRATRNGIIISDARLPDCPIIFANPAFEELTGYSAEEVLGQNCRFLQGDEHDQPGLAELRAALREARGVDVVVRNYRKDGSAFWNELRLAPILSESGELTHFIGVQTDVTGRIETQDALASQRTFLRSVIDNDPNLIFIKDEAGCFRMANQALADLYGTTVDNLIGKGDADFNADPAEVEVFRRADRVLLDTLTEHFTPEEKITDPAGRVRWLQTVKRPIYSPDAGTYHILGIATDITERKMFEERLAYQAFHDPLTGLPNRALFLDRLDHALVSSKRTQQPVAVLFLDLDNFKVINDSLGHRAGDALLLVVAERLRQTLRAGDTIARFGGDEFTLLLENLGEESEILAVAERVANALRERVTLEGHEVVPSGSIGVAISCGQYDFAGDVLRDADTAMYRAKTAGKSGFVVFDPSMNQEAMERLDLEVALRRAIESEELRVLYQPILELNSGRLCGLEALVRWEHPRYGCVLPEKFIAIAEETGLIIPLGRWVLTEVCRQIHTWEHGLPDHEGFPPVSINLSARQLHYPGLSTDIRNTLAAFDVAPSRLKVEITESMLLDDSGRATSALCELKALGIFIAVDDFGIGYSSLSYLKELPIDALKIDRTFVSRLGQPAGDDAIIQAIIALAKSLHLQVTSEGIETPDQLAFLQRLKCDHGQGFLFAQPLTPQAVEEFRIAPPTALSR